MKRTMNDKTTNIKRYKRIFEHSSLFGYDVIDFEIYLGKRKGYWRLFITNYEGIKGDVKTQKDIK